MRDGVYIECETRRYKLAPVVSPSTGKTTGHAPNAKREPDGVVTLTVFGGDVDSVTEYRVSPEALRRIVDALGDETMATLLERSK